MRRKWFLIVAGCVLVFGGVAAVLLQTAPETSTVVVSECVSASEGETCLRYPTITGQNLPGTEFTLPADFAGDYIIVLTPFDREQQQLANTWLPLAGELASAYSGLTYYNVPIFPDLAAPIRMMSRTGLTALIDDDHLRQVTITVFLEDREAFLTALEVPDVEHIRVYLLNADGDVLWQTSGEYTVEAGNQLRQEIQRLGIPQA